MEMRQKTAIVGCARSGIGAAKLAAHLGHEVVVVDQKEREKFDATMKELIERLEAQHIQFLLGTNQDLAPYDLIIMSPGVPLDIPMVQEAMNRGQEVIGEFEFAYRQAKAPVVAITGTNGKTTTTALVGQIIKAYNPETYVVGNIGRAFSEDVLAIPSDGVIVAEASSFQLETTNTFHPRVAALLNITPDHLNRHKTMEKY